MVSDTTAPADAASGTSASSEPVASTAPEETPTSNKPSTETSNEPSNEDDSLDVLDGLTIAVDREVRFDPGGTSATLDGAVIRGERDVYRVGARAGQRLDLDITSTEDNAVFDVFDPDGRLVADETTAAEITLTATGDHLIVVGGTRGNATYRLTVSIPA